MLPDFNWSAPRAGRRYRDRHAAGRDLAARLAGWAGHEPLVLALPRGGVPVAYELALALRAPLDVLLVRKLGVPGQEELALGAIASGGVRVLNDAVVASTGISAETIERVAAAEQAELERRERAYRGALPALELRGRLVILVDDGLATGASMRAAVAAVRARGVAQVTVAVPVAARESCEEMAHLVDHVVCGLTPEPFYAVSMGYEEFDQTTDDEVRELLAAAAARGDG